ncbi:MAG: putative quinol monooxygenase [Ilumatobacteraceae bacterium]
MSSSTKVGVWVTLTLKPGTRDEAAATINEAIEAAKGESGTLVYVLNADVANPDLLHFYEVYENQDAMNAHMGSEWFAAFSPKLVPFLAGAPAFQMLAPLGGKGI